MRTLYSILARCILPLTASNCKLHIENFQLDFVNFCLRFSDHWRGVGVGEGIDLFLRLFQLFNTLCTSQIEASTSPPPGHLNFWKSFVQIPPSPDRKAVQMPPPLGKLPDYCFNFSVASIMLLGSILPRHVPQD